MAIVLFKADMIRELYRKLCPRLVFLRIAIRTIPSKPAV